MKITSLIGREIFDSRGLPTIACEVTLENGVTVCASVPSGASTGEHEAVEMRDGGARLFGKGVLHAIENIHHVIAPALVGHEINALVMDQTIIKLDGTPNKSNLGANATLAVSMALYRAQAAAEELELYELLAWMMGGNGVALPIPLINLINGGRHADNGLVIQEFMIVPLGAESFRHAIEASAAVQHNLKMLLKKYERSTTVGDEGGFASDFSDELEALDFLSEAIEKTDPDGEIGFGIALDVAASEFYNPKTQSYHWREKKMSADELIELYDQLRNAYPIFSIEDGLAQDDWEHWGHLYQSLGEELQIVGDDLFVTDIARIAHGIEHDVANAVIIKPNQVGTICETLDAIRLCKEHEMGAIISHRSGETEDTFIADLAVGTHAGEIKTGALCRGERTAKYNRLLAIEDELTQAMLETEQ